MSATKIIDRMKAREQERAYLLAVLDLWAQTQAQGFDPETVQSFGFDPKLLSGKDARAYHQPAWTPNPFYQRRKDGSIRTLIHNYVRLKDGTIQPLNPMLKAVRHFEDID